MTGTSASLAAAAGAPVDEVVGKVVDKVVDTVVDEIVGPRMVATSTARRTQAWEWEEEEKGSHCRLR